MKPQSCNILNCYPICARINKCLPWDFLHCCLIPEEVTRLNKYNKPTICFLIFTLFLLKSQLVSLAYFSIFACQPCNVLNFVTLLLKSQRVTFAICFFPKALQVHIFRRNKALWTCETLPENVYFAHFARKCLQGYSPLRC